MSKDNHVKVNRDKLYFSWTYADYRQSQGRRNLVPNQWSCLITCMIRSGRIPKQSKTLGNVWEPLRIACRLRLYGLTLIEVCNPLVLTPSPSVHLCRWSERRISIRRHFLQWRDDPLILRIIFSQFSNVFWSPCWSTKKDRRRIDCSVHSTSSSIEPLCQWGFLWHSRDD